MTPETEAECWRLIHEMETITEQLRASFRIMGDEIRTLGPVVDRLDMHTREFCHGIEAQVPLLDQLGACVEDHKPEP